VGNSSDHLQWGQLWEWTNSAYLAYPGFNKSSGALEEYNGKLWINQMILRGSAVATTEGHSRKHIEISSTQSALAI
jgi:formylglycine-generating enzyme required for sulfatase activity